MSGWMGQEWNSSTFAEDIRRPWPWIVTGLVVLFLGVIGCLAQ